MHTSSLITRQRAEQVNETLLTDCPEPETTHTHIHTLTHRPPLQTSITHLCSLSRKLGEGRAATQPPTHATNTRNKNTHTHTHVDPLPAPPSPLNLSPFSPYTNTDKPLSNLSSFCPLKLMTGGKERTRHAHVNAPPHGINTAHLNTSRVSFSSGPRGAADHKAVLVVTTSVFSFFLNKSSKYARRCLESPTYLLPDDGGCNAPLRAERGARL